MWATPTVTAMFLLGHPPFYLLMEAEAWVIIYKLLCKEQRRP
jgi:hypothetical protein